MQNPCIFNSNNSPAMSNPFAPNRVLRQPMMDIRKTYEFGEEIASGQSGVTHLVTHRRSRQNFACKSIDKENLRLIDGSEAVRREVDILRLLAGSPYIVKLIEACEDSKNVYLVMEHCKGGTLIDRIKKRGGRFLEKDAAEIFRQIVRGIEECHLMGLMHRDLHTENVLFLNDSLTIKIIDFGASVFFEPG